MLRSCRMGDLCMMLSQMGSNEFSVHCCLSCVHATFVPCSDICVKYTHSKYIEFLVAIDAVEGQDVQAAIQVWSGWGGRWMGWKLVCVGGNVVILTDTCDGQVALCKIFSSTPPHTCHSISPSKVHLC
jgi:hypothetical protein